MKDDNNPRDEMTVREELMWLGWIGAVGLAIWAVLRAVFG